MIDQRLPRRRRKKKAKRRSTKAGTPFSSPIVILGLCFVVLLGMFVAAVFAFDYLSKLSKVEAAVEWPPSSGDFLGDMDGDTVLPVSENTIDSALQRRKIDPWFKISNLRMEQDGNSSVLVFDVDRTEKATYDRMEYQVKVNAVGGPLGLTFDSGFNQYIRSNRRSTTLRYRLSLDGHRDFEVYIDAFDRRYQYGFVRKAYSSSKLNHARFRVSTTATLGNVPNPSYSREWTNEEEELLLRPISGVETKIVEYEKDDRGNLIFQERVQ